MASITQAARRFKLGATESISAKLVDDACRAAGHVWRRRVLDPTTIVRLMVLQMLWGNASGTELARIARFGCTVSAYIKARKRLPLDVIEGVFRAFTRDASESLGGRRWRGHRVLMIDGSGVSMPDTPSLQARFGQPTGAKPGCGFPVMHTLWLFDMATGLVIDVVINRWNTHDLADASKLHRHLGTGDVLLADRAFCSFAHLALLLQSNAHAVFHLHQRVKADFREGRECRADLPKHRRRGAPTSRQICRNGKDDHVVEWFKPKRRASWMNAAAHDGLPDSIGLREVRCTLARPGYRSRKIVLVTTLLDDATYPAESLAELYLDRWLVETNLGYLKQAMRVEPLRHKSEDSACKALWAAMLAYNLVRREMAEAAAARGIDANRVSFVDTMTGLRHGTWRERCASYRINPLRPGRGQPRVIKRRKDRYSYMTTPRPKPRRKLALQGDAA